MRKYTDFMAIYNALYTNYAVQTGRNYTKEHDNTEN